LVIYGKEVLTPRFSRNYLSPYLYTGVLHPGHPLPDAFKPLHEWAGGLEKYNQCLVNWYDGSLNHYIGPHSDSEKEIDGSVEILSVSLGHTRTFRITDKKDGKEVRRLFMPDGSYIKMGGDFQNEFRHEVPKMSKKELNAPPACKRRVNLTFRRLKT